MNLKSRTILSLLLCSALMVGAQTRVVYGKVTAYNQYPLQNIQVIAKKSKAAVKTDSLGMFSIVCMEKDVIKVKPKAFMSATRKVGSHSDTLLINLVFIDNKSNRELATGYGYINQKDLAYAVSHMQQENNDFCNYQDIFELVTGKFPGVIVSNKSIQIRGASSINSSTEALYVVDGGITNNIEWIHPCDVYSVDVLKDGMTAIYGSRGANGVIVIETRRGRHQAP
ncbi:MAG: TonB-dependent receptor plug domain-containing protein [Bacteroidetes bacterium]|nr:TonB-dependent receptor plug domain-containing protein [Bacteroidota bacterium]